MSDDNPHSTNGSAPKGWIDKIKDTFSPEPTNHEELVDVITEAELNAVINPQTREMIEGVIEVNKMKVRDIMIPRAQMITIDVNAAADTLLPQVSDSAHSRFPVISEDKDHIEGILLAKDLLAYGFDNSRTLELKDILREAVIVPESKRVDILLKEFRQQRYHMAIVVDEYGGVSGLVTIEDILELIVGEIEDEHDVDEGKFWAREKNGQYVALARAPLDEFQAELGINLTADKDIDEEEIDTLRLWAMSKAMTIAGGSSEIQLNVIAKSVLELPQPGGK